MMRHLLGLAMVVCAGATAAGADSTIPRYIEFRDGSVLRLSVVDQDWKVTLLHPEGELETTVVRLSSFQELTLAPQRVFAKTRASLAAVQQLGSDDFSEREQAEKTLMEMGPSIRPDLNLALELYSDVEIRYRINRILSHGQEERTNPAALKIPFDRVALTQSLWADTGDCAIEVRMGEITRRLSRREVAAMSVAPPVLYGLDTSPHDQVGFRRIGDKDFPGGCLEEGFETAPNGHPLTVGENIEKVFLDKGFLLSTSIKDSFVSVNHFQVNGKTRGLSIATHQPLYQGEVTIRFVQPGREHVPAGVHYFGCWMAVVTHQGTALVAYDLQGRELGKVETEQGPHEFVGIYSAQPMHEIRVVPNLAIDPDYTLDDFIYSLPQPASVRHTEKFTATFASSERVLCDEVTLGDGQVHMHGLAGGLPDMTRPQGKLVQITTPSNGRPERALPESVLAQLIDGSVIVGAAPAAGKGGALTFAHYPDLLKEPDKFAGLWKPGSMPGTRPPAGSEPALWDPEKKAWQKISDVKLTSDAILWLGEGGKRQQQAYLQMRPLVLRQAADARPGNWHVHTLAGEDLVLESRPSPELSGTMATDLTVKWQGKVVKLPGQEMLSISQVLKAP